MLKSANEGRLLSQLEIPIRYIPRNRRQVYDVLQKVPDRVKSRNTGKHKTPEITKLLSYMYSSKFVCYISLHASLKEKKI